MEFRGRASRTPRRKFEALAKPPLDLNKLPFDPLEYVEHLDELPFDPSADPHFGE